MKNILFFSVLLILISGCNFSSNKDQSGAPDAEDLNWNYSGLPDFTRSDTIDLAYRECLSDAGNHNYLCFESVLSDSRCPVNVQCIWAGEASARFSFKDQAHDSPIRINLRLGDSDTLDNGCIIKFIDLLPYPNTEIPFEPEDYVARVAFINKLPE
jgi:hypothetical protein